MPVSVDSSKLELGPAVVEILETKTGTVAVNGTTSALTGTGTKFLTELAVGEEVFIATIAGSFIVATITSDVAATLTTIPATAVSLKTLTGFTNIGATKDGITFEVETETAEIVTDQTGTTPVDQIVTGRRVKIMVPFAEQKLENWKRALAESNAIVVNGVKRRLDISTSVGLSLRLTAKTIRIIPLINGNTLETNKEKIYTIPLAVPSSETVSMQFDVSTQRVMNASFVALPELTPNNAVTNSRLAYVGDGTA